MHLDDPCVVAPTIFVDTGNIQATNFDIDPVTQQTLYKNGFSSAQYFLSQWHWNNYLDQCRSGAPAPAPAAAAPPST